jgi:hypothetical protein
MIKLLTMEVEKVFVNMNRAPSGGVRPKIIGSFKGSTLSDGSRAPPSKKKKESGNVLKIARIYVRWKSDIG